MSPNSAIASTRLRLVLLTLLTVLSLGGQRTMAAPAAGALKLGKEDVVAFLGGEDVVEMQRNGYLELLLSRHFRDSLPKFRYLAWEGDTVYEQRRDLNFGSWSNQLQRAGATVIIAQFGQSESLKGKAALPQFIAAYEALLDQWAAPGRQIVLVPPTSFEKPSGQLPDLTRHNSDLGQYTKAIETLAGRRGCTFVRLSAFSGKQSGVLTRDGLHLNEAGHLALAGNIAAQIGAGSGPKAGPQISRTGEKVRQIIVAKNQLWFDYWRPMNWAFLNGDRTTQPSSRDHRDPTIRWFPKEMEEFLPLIEKQEAEIARLLKELP